MAEMFEGEAFSYFLEALGEKEKMDLEELVEPMFKSDKLSNNEYAFLIRGRLEVYNQIKEDIAKIISLAKKYALQN
ncbi:MAG: hypothetical protein QXO70_01735 [Candidatus Pacearchaeota archaeon]